MTSTKNELKMLAENLRLFRKSVDISQKELARLADVTQANVSQWENGASTPPIAVIQVIKKNFPKVNAESFFTPPFNGKNFLEDPMSHELRVNKEENAALRRDLKLQEAIVKEQKDEISRLRDQVEVLNMIIRQKLIK